MPNDADVCESLANEVEKVSSTASFAMVTRVVLIICIQKSFTSTMSP